MSWTKHKLDELGFVGRGRSRHRPRNDSILYGGSYPFIQTSDIKNATLTINRYSQTYNEKGLSQSKMWNLGTLCITIAANIAETAILGIKACFPDSIVGFIADPKKADVHFIKYYIGNIKLQMQNVSKGTTQDNLSLDKLMRFDFCVPEVSLQKKIATIISNYDYLIENNNRRIKILEEMTQTIYNEWFVKFRFPGHSKVKMVDSELGKIPQGWDIKAINAIIEIKGGFPFKSTTFDKNGDYGIVAIKNVQDGRFIAQCQNFIEEIPEKMPKHCVLVDGDILLSLTGNIGRVCLVYGDEYLLNQRVAKLVPKDNDDRAYIYFLYFQPEFRTKLEQISTGVAQQNLSPIEMGKLKIAYPVNTIRRRYSEVCNPVLEEMVVLFRKNLLLQQTRDLLLPELISGEIGVEDMDIDIGGVD